jgi:hypothetical protein
MLSNGHGRNKFARHESISLGARHGDLRSIMSAEALRPSDCQALKNRWQLELPRGARTVYGTDRDAREISDQ